MEFTIGVVSDTHIPRKSKSFPNNLIEGIRGVNMIFHAGDINKDYVIFELEEIAPVEAVAGNTDDEYMHDWLGTKKIVSVGNTKIGLIHGDGGSGTTLERVKKAFEGESVACVVFGHSHIPFNEVINGVLYFNPGSSTDKRRQERYSYGLMYIRDEKIEGEIIYFD